MALASRMRQGIEAEGLCPRCHSRRRTSHFLEAWSSQTQRRPRLSVWEMTRKFKCVRGYCCWLHPLLHREPQLAQRGAWGNGTWLRVLPTKGGYVPDAHQPLVTGPCPRPTGNWRCNATFQMEVPRQRKIKQKIHKSQAQLTRPYCQVSTIRL